MARTRLSMRKIKEIMRLRLSKGYSIREISKALGIAQSTVGDCIRRINAASLDWPLDDGITDQFLEELLYVKSNEIQKNLPEPNYELIHQELPKKGVTLQLLWQEYKEMYPNGYQYSQFCSNYRQWSKTINLSMRQSHAPGDKVFVDYAGKTVPIYCLYSGNIVYRAQIFVGVLGASNYTFAIASRDQKKESWIRAHIEMFKFFNGVPNKIIPDNLKSAVSKACKYDPDINPTYLEMAKHYDTVILPARVRKPKDKAKAEIGVNLVSRWILAVIRNEKFYSLEDLNKRIRELLIKLNNKPFQKLEGNRHSKFLGIDQPSLNKLPENPYIYTNIKIARVHIDYHIEVEKHFYSVPYKQVSKEVEVRYNDHIVEVFYKNKKISSHMRSYNKGRYTTCTEHMPSRHQAYAKWSPERLTNWASKIGPNTAMVCSEIIESKKYPEQGFKPVLGVIRLSKQYGDDRLEAASAKALKIKSPNYKSIKSILKVGFDRENHMFQEKKAIPKHQNIRGSEYYNNLLK